jgi:hypothetical protein
MGLNKTEVLICDCFSPDHQYLLTVDEEDGVGRKRERIGYIHPHLVKKSFWYRLKYGLKYIFGRKSRYGAWDEIIITKDNVILLEDFVAKIKENV